MANALATISRIRKSLATVKTIPEVKDFRDKAAALRDYFKGQKDGLESSNVAAEVMLQCERRAGALLAETEKQNGGHAMKARSQAVTEVPLALSDLGITKMQSSRWQAEARVPESDFEAFVTKHKEGGRQLTSAALIKLGRQQAASKPSKKHRKARKQTSVVTTLDELVGQTFACIYADPPWKYGNQGTRGSTDNHYQTMTVDEIAKEPVGALTAEDCHLHLWTTNAFLFESREILEAWGFTYKSCFIWVKPQMGMGNYWRLAHEFLLFGVKGSLPFENKSQISWVQAGRTKHSSKPRIVRELVEKVSPGPYLELYGREQIPGWTVYGNQVSEQTRFA